MSSGGERKALFKFDYRRSADQDAPAPVRHPVVIVGAGPVGLATAIDLTQRGVCVVQWRSLAALASDDGVHSETLACTALVVLVVGDTKVSGSPNLKARALSTRAGKRAGLAAEHHSALGLHCMRRRAAMEINEHF